MALWSIMAAPLLMGNDLRNLDPAMKAILQAKEVIAIDQDPLGIQGRRVEHNTTGSGYFFGDVWTKLLANDDLAVLLWNRCDYGTPRVMAANWTLLGLDAGKRMKVRVPLHSSNLIFVLGFRFYAELGDAAGIDIAPPQLWLDNHPAKSSAFADVRVFDDVCAFDDVICFTAIQVRDLYAEKDLGVFQDKVSLGVDIWDVAMLRMSPA